MRLFCSFASSRRGFSIFLLSRRKGSLLCLIKVTQNQGWRSFVVSATLWCVAHGLGLRPTESAQRLGPSWVCAIRTFLQRTSTAFTSKPAQAV